MKLQNIDHRDLNEKAQRFFEGSDGGALEDLFGHCKTYEEINEVANELYDEFFDDEE